MRKFVVKVALVASALSVVMAAPVFAASPQSICENSAEGATFQKEPGVKRCEVPGKNDKFTKVTSQKGSFNSSHAPVEECKRPGNAEECPPGQFK
jgi:hypothetical protein